MKKVTIENVKARIDDLEDIKANTTIGISLREEFELECLRKLFDLLALRERAEPVAWRHDDGPFASGALTRSKSVAESWIGKGWKVTPLYTAPPAPVVPADVDPSFDAMMRALDAFYADDDVPERAMLAAFKILMADVQKQSPEEPATDTTSQQFESLATSAGSGKHGQ